MLPSLGTVEDLEISYAELEQKEPPSREEELDRQYTLRIWSQRLADAYNNTATCQQMLTDGWQSLPTDEQERAEANQVRARIAEIDQELRSNK